MLQSDRLFLSADIDFNLARKSRNHPSVRKWCRQYTLISEAEQERWSKKIDEDPTIKMFAICKNEGFHPIVGVCGFTSIDQHNRSAEFSLYINPDDQGHGYGSEGLRLLLNHGFYDFGFHRVWGEVFEGNPALKTFEKLGFKINGILRHSYYREGCFIDSIMIDMLDHEWKSRRV
jgi:RimJ/RimL family protein N-acetyltransferase